MRIVSPGRGRVVYYSETELFVAWDELPNYEPTSYNIFCQAAPGFHAHTTRRRRTCTQAGQAQGRTRTVRTARHRCGVGGIGSFHR